MVGQLPPLPLGIQTFRTVREKGMVYVDKTPFIETMLDSYSRVFLSRPRRFGKSLFLSTLESYFKGEREFFDGLSLMPKTGALPVIRLDLSIVLTDHRLEESLLDRVCAQGEALGVRIDKRSPAEAFAFLIRSVAGRGRCVVLIDEYDKPVTEAFSNPALLANNINILKTFYSVVKAEDASIEFCFITGGSRFSKVSIFSGINNLKDISLLPGYSSLCGYTRQELLEYFGEWIDHCATSLSLSFEEFIEVLQSQYNGYRFSSSPVTVFNPISVLNALSDQRFGNYWYETATPTFLIERVRGEKREPQTFDRLENVQLGLEPTNASAVGIEELLYQTGYLTIKGAKQERRQLRYTLGWPNREVKESFYESLVKEYSDNQLPRGVLVELSDALSTKELDKFFEAFNRVLATIPYTLFTKRESYYHSLLHVVLQVVGVVVHSEKLTSLGRIDLVCETPNFLYIFECKLDDSVDAAIEQVQARRYATRYLNEERQSVVVGVSFSSQTRSVANWKEVKG